MFTPVDKIGESMFKKTVNLTEFRSNALSLLKELGNGDGEAIQLVHRGQSIKVIITQERYFQLLEALESYQGRQEKLVGHPSEIEIRRALGAIKDALGAEDRPAQWK